MRPVYSQFDAIRDLHHWSYKAPGLLAWIVILSIAYTMVEFPAVALAWVRLLGLYVVLRVFIALIFYPIGLIRIDRARARTRQAAGAPVSRLVHHVVLVPNHYEPLAILARTLDGLALQTCARRRLIVVLAMEASEAGADEKARVLRRRFAGKFARFVVTMHPADLPGEVPGKGANQRWAARQVRTMLERDFGLPLEWVTLTSCDADSLLDPAYFETIARSFMAQPARHHCFWQSPLRFENNIWRVPGPVRVLTMLANVVNLSELANPFMLKWTQSTYTLSYLLADRIDYWDPCVLAEDSNILLRALFATGGHVSVTPVMLPTRSDAVFGDTFWRALRNFYRQRMRHAWSCQNFGYIVQRWHRAEGVTLSQKLLYLLQVLQDFTLYATAAFVLAGGWLLGLVVTRSPVVSFFDLAIPAIFFVALNLVGALGMWVMWASEHIRCSHSASGWRPFHLVSDVATWCVMPVATLALAVAPVLHANTRMLLGGEVRYLRTQKEGAIVQPD